VRIAITAPWLTKTNMEVMIDLAPKYCEDFECDINIGIILGMEKEVMDGKGPVRFEPEEYFFKNPLAAEGFLFRWDRPVAKKFWETLFEKEARYTSDHSKRPEAIPGFFGELSCIRVDHLMKTSLRGLWALGDTSHGGSAWAGATAAPAGRIRGAPLMYTNVSALLGARSVTDELPEAGKPIIDPEQVAYYKGKIYAPMNRDKGISPRDLIFDLKEVVAPPRYSARKSKERLSEAIGKVKEIQERLLEVSPGGDWHMLGLYHDLRNMVQCSDIYFNASLHRTESRGWHYREDFPVRNDENWFKWVIVKQEDGLMQVVTEDIPIDRYKSKLNSTDFGNGADYPPCRPECLCPGWSNRYSTGYHIQGCFTVRCSDDYLCHYYCCFPPDRPVHT
jgi:succinate dehydrogenase / fumarate reductase flavoprotein subunit